MKVIITGDSHTGALQAGKKKIIEGGEWPAELDLTVRPLGGGHLLPTPFFKVENGYAVITEETYKDRFKTLPLVGGEDWTYGICAPLHTVRLYRSNDWGKFAPAGLAINEVPLSRALINRMVLDDQRYVLLLIDTLLQSGAKVFAIEPPQPFRHHHAFKKVRKEVLLNLNAEYRKLMRAELAKRNIDIISVPLELCDEEGFMKEAYRHENEKDVHHGNAAFGKIMMAEILTYIRGKR